MIRDTIIISLCSSQSDLGVSSIVISSLSQRNLSIFHFLSSEYHMIQTKENGSVNLRLDISIKLNGSLTQMLRYHHVYILKHLLSMSANSGRTFTLISKNNCYF